MSLCLMVLPVDNSYAMHVCSRALGHRGKHRCDPDHCTHQWDADAWGRG